MGRFHGATQGVGHDVGPAAGAPAGKGRRAGRGEGWVGRGYCGLPQGTEGVNALTDPLASPGFGAPFAESWITLDKG